MLKIYTVVSYVSIDGAKWRSVGSAGYCCTDEDLDIKVVLDNASFKEVCEYNSNHFIDGIWNSNTFWRKKPVIVVKYRDAWNDVVYKHFHTMSYKNVYTECKNVSFEWLIKHLTADQLIQYLKERGITTCPILK